MSRFSNLIAALLLSLPTCLLIAADPTPTTLPTTSPNKVTGLSIPADFEVNYDEGFVTLKAECVGPIEWIVLGVKDDADKDPAPLKVKYKLNPVEKEIDIAVPPKQCVIIVYCYGVVENKPTKAVRCDISVNGQVAPRPPPAPTPPPTPTPPPVPVTGKLHVTVIEDPRARSPEYTILTRWLVSRAAMESKNLLPHLLSTADPLYLDPNNKYQKYVQQIGSIPAVIVQDEQGKLINYFKCPKTVEELLQQLGR